MDRQVVYAGAVPVDTDQLLQSRNAMVALGYLAKMVVGDGSSYADGLTCAPGNGLAVNVSPGSLSVPTVVDSGAFGILPPNGDPLVKIGVNTKVTPLSLPSSGTYVVSAAFEEAPAGDTVLAYYDAEAPSQTLYGPAGNGEAQATVLQQRVSLSLTAGTQPPAGSVPLWVVTVPSGVTAITQSMISQAPGAPFLAVKLPTAAPLASPNFSGQPTAPTPTTGDDSTLLATTAFVNGATKRFRSVWTSSGTYSWVCPSGVYQVLFRGWGPGGGGGGGSNGSPGGGGGGGGYLEVLLSVVPGQSYEVVVGVGGTVSTAVSATSFGGATSVFGGGNGGNGGSGQVGVGGTAGSDAVLQLEALSNPGAGFGQSGYVIGTTAVGGAGGGSFGTPPSYPNMSGAAGTTGFWPGGGGSGGANGAGGSGANGLVIIEWFGSPSS